MMHENNKAIHAFENVLRLNPHNVKALAQLASICTILERYKQVRHKRQIFASREVLACFWCLVDASQLRYFGDISLPTPLYRFLVAR